MNNLFACNKKVTQSEFFPLLLAVCSQLPVTQITTRKDRHHNEPASLSEVNTQDLLSHGHGKLGHRHTNTEVQSGSLISKRKRRALSAAERGVQEKWVAGSAVECKEFHR